MTKPTEKLTAREFVWVNRLRQRIVLERIILTIGNSKEKSRAKQFLDAMEQAHPELFDDIDDLMPEFLDDNAHGTPELFDESEYAKATGRKRALKLPKDILWEERIIRRAIKDYMDLFHPCDNIFNNAIKGLKYLHTLHPEIFAKAKELAASHRDQILTLEIYCKCGCTTPKSSRPADSFTNSNQGRFENVSRRIAAAKKALNAAGDYGPVEWQFFLDRIRDVAPEMLD